jgi:hypothetical protein
VLAKFSAIANFSSVVAVAIWKSAAELTNRQQRQYSLIPRNSQLDQTRHNLSLVDDRPMETLPTNEQMERMRRYWAPAPSSDFVSYADIPPLLDHVIPPDKPKPPMKPIPASPFRTDDDFYIEPAPRVRSPRLPPPPAAAPPQLSPFTPEFVPAKRLPLAKPKPLLSKEFDRDKYLKVLFGPPKRRVPSFPPRQLKKAVRIDLTPEPAPVPSTLSFARFPIYVYCLFISLLYIDLVSVPSNSWPMGNESSGVVLFDTEELPLKLRDVVAVLLLTLTFMAFAELMNCPDFISYVIMPVLVLADQLVVHSIAVSLVFGLQVVLVFAAFRVLVWNAERWSVVISFVLLGVAAAWRLEFGVFLIPVLLVSVCEKKKYREAGVGFALSVVIIVIGQQTTGWSVLDLSTGNRLDVSALRSSDRNGLLVASIITVLMALCLRVDKFLAIGLILAAILAFVSPIVSRQDQELSGVIAVRLIAYVWVAIGAKRNAWWITAGAMLVKVIFDSILAPLWDDPASFAKSLFGGNLVSGH